MDALMAGATRISFEMVGGKGAGAVAARRIERAGWRAQNAEPVFRRIHQSFLASERARFSGRNDWRPLTRRYLADKARRGLDPRIMRATGELYKALGSGTGPGAVTDIGPVEAVFGTSLPRAVYAQRGTGRRRRRLIVIGRARRARWARQVETWIATAVIK